MNRRLLFIMRHAPYGNSVAREALDALLAAAVFGQNLAVLFMDDGVFQLMPNQAPAALPQKSLAANLSALPLYDVDQLYVHTPSLSARGLRTDELLLEGMLPLDNDAVADLMAQQDQLLSF